MLRTTSKTTTTRINHQTQQTRHLSTHSQNVIHTKNRVKRSLKQKPLTLTPSTNVANHQPISQSPHGVLSRDFVRESLYSKQGYFNASRVINSPGVINFTQLLGKAAYEKRLEELYYQGVQGWSTPVEIFQPYYAHAIARFFVSHIIPSINQNSTVSYSDAVKLYEHVANRMRTEGLLTNPSRHAALLTELTHLTDQADFWPTFNKNHIILNDLSTLPEPSQPIPSVIFTDTAGHGNIIANFPIELDAQLRRYGAHELKKIVRDEPTTSQSHRIVEIGAGNGTCASNILDFLKTFYPNVYKKIDYTILEMSEALSHQQKELLDSVHHGKYNVLTVNAAEYVPVIHDALHKQNMMVKNQSIIPQKTSQVEQHAFVFGLEVLDNMVHDKVIKGTDGKYYQIMVAEKKVMEKIRDDQAKLDTDPSLINEKQPKTFKIKQYLHPDEEFDHYASQTRNNQIDNNTNNSSLTLPFELPKHNNIELSQQELLNYVFNKPLPINYKKLNAHNDPNLKYVEYAMPLTDPIISECIKLYDEYRVSPYHNKYNRTGAINFQHQFNTAETHFTHGQTDDRNIFHRFVAKIMSNNLLKDVEEDVIYLPTELLRFIHRIDRAFPSHTLFLADFDVLPTTEIIRAKNAPVVAKKAENAEQRGKTIDELTYMVDMGQCDIFYPTDFNFLRYMYSNIVLTNSNNKDEKVKMENNGNIHAQKEIKYDDIHDSIHPYIHNILSQTKQTGEEMKHKMLQFILNPTPFRNLSTALTQNEFLYKFSTIEQTQCKNGFNPMMEDYNNMAIFIGQRK